MHQGIGPDGGLQIGAGRLHRGLDIGEELADLPGDRLALNGSGDRTAASMTHDQDGIGPQHGGSILEAGHDLRSNDVAGNAGDKQLADGLIENHFHGHPRIGTGENRGEGFLFLQHLVQHGEITPVGGGPAAGEAAVAGDQLLQSGLGAQPFALTLGWGKYR